MCSIVGYLGNAASKDHILEGLSRLEYRGYDSSGYAWISATKNHLQCIKAVGDLTELKKALERTADEPPSPIGIGHTRWATHGAACEKNAHPHMDCKKKLAIVHNGIIENYLDIKNRLDATHQYSSDTDTELIAHLFEDHASKNLNLFDSVKNIVSILEGSYAFLAILESDPHTIVSARKRSPLCIGIDENNTFIASDPFAFAGKAHSVIFLPDETFALITPNKVSIYRFDGTPITVESQLLNMVSEETEKKGHAHYMLKEIYEQKGAIATTIKHSTNHLVRLIDHIDQSIIPISDIERIHIIACGTSWHAGQIGRFFFEQICTIPVSIDIASEFRYQTFFPNKKCHYIFISQSGETADTLEAMRLVKMHHLKPIVISNIDSSTMVRESAGSIITHAGREISVASTKAFTTQIAILYLFSQTIAIKKGSATAESLITTCNDIEYAATTLDNSLEKYGPLIKTIYGPRYAAYSEIIFLGRNISYPLAQEAALKFKELTYQFACAEPSGELKHGPLALIQPQLPVFIFAPLDPILYKKMVINAQEIKARNGHLVIFAFEGQEELSSLADVVFTIPHTNPLLGTLAMTGLMQLLIYAIANTLGRPIDKPRNLAKSVTVE